VKYEDLAINTEKTLIRLSSEIQLDIDCSVHRDFRAKQNFAVSGNKMRWENRPIQLDERWCKELPTVVKWIVRLITSPIAFCLFRYK